MTEFSELFPFKRIDVSKSVVERFSDATGIHIKELSITVGKEEGEISDEKLFELLMEFHRGIIDEYSVPFDQLKSNPPFTGVEKKKLSDF